MLSWLSTLQTTDSRHQALQKSNEVLVSQEVLNII
jgi:hypothetical protein